MSDSRLKTAILGLTGEGCELLEAAYRSNVFDIVAVGDEDTELAEKMALTCECTPFDDYRQLIIQNQIDVLIVAAPVYQCDEHVRVAMKKKFHILRVAPAGFDFEQTAETVRLAKKEKVAFAVANTGRFYPGFMELKKHLQTAEPTRFHLISAVCNELTTPDDLHDRWLSDPELAGGGVLLQNCYGLIDQIVLNFGLPEQVYSLNTNHAPDKQQRLSITEDTAVLTMKFSDTMIANLTASRVFGPPEKLLRIHGKDTCLLAGADSFTIMDNQGNTTDQLQTGMEKRQAQTMMLEDFAQSILSPDSQKTDSNVDLKNMAVIEAAYLSARTGMPEEPARILDMVKT
ncbi:MAG: Gfo/Idh/MocA family oxidoreductase [Gammaproteobacteria bacterium]|nr:Gfo/Idh/MocA family oxidoreductase [Gammaproteobacteria bacterium]